MTDTSTTEDDAESDKREEGYRGHPSTASTSTDASQPRIATIFGTTIEEHDRVPYSADRALEQAATLLEYDSTIEDAEEVAAFSEHYLGIGFPGPAVEYAKQKQQTELVSTDLRTLCYLIEGHGNWYQQHGRARCVRHSIHIRIRRSISWLNQGSLPVGQRITATAKRIGRLPATVRNNRVSKRLIDYFKI